MLNMGGPSSLDGAADGVRPFLKRLFSDKEIIQLGGGFLQRAVGSFVSSRRSPRIKEQYAAIGGGSPIGKWTALQSAAMVARLNELMPEQVRGRAFIFIFFCRRARPPLAPPPPPSPCLASSSAPLTSRRARAAGRRGRLPRVHRLPLRAAAHRRRAARNGGRRR